jgi:hypothetical protein
MKNITEERLSTADLVSAGDTRTKTEKVQDEKQADRMGKPVEASGAQRERDGQGTLLPAAVVQDLRSRWSSVQAGFVDEPQAAVRQADELVAVAMKRLAEGFTEQRNTLEHQWSGGKDVSTEDLRAALRKYRAFFERLLAMPAPAER